MNALAVPKHGKVMVITYDTLVITAREWHWWKSKAD